jgi:hypothetical protein
MLKAHFITSRPTIENDIDIIRKLIDVIHSNHYSLALDWIEVAFRRQSQNKSADSWTRIYDENLMAVSEADVVIAEATYENLAVGYQIAAALQQAKPILILRRESADKNAFVTGIEDGWVEHAEYTEKNLEDIVEKFLQHNQITVKDMRFNFFIDRRIHNYLRFAAFKSGKTKAEVVREIIRADIKKDTL